MVFFISIENLRFWNVLFGCLDWVLISLVMVFSLRWKFLVLGSDSAVKENVGVCILLNFGFWIREIGFG